MKRVILLTLWTAAVACVASFATIAVSPLLVDVDPFSRLLFFQAIRVRGNGGTPAGKPASDRYRYLRYDGLPVRIDNDSGEAELLTGNGWRPMKPAFTPPPGDAVR